MKKIIIALTINFVCLNFSFGQCCGDVEMYDIFTPMGEPVKTFLMIHDDDIYFREAIDDIWTSSYPNAEKILVYDSLSSTRRFNCHGYAWLRIEQGISRWIGYYEDNRDPDMYMWDESYILASSEVFPAKVFWDRPNGDHTAITTEELGWFISKWNIFPLFRHRWDDSPYGTNFKYFVRNCFYLAGETIHITNRVITSYTPIKSCGDFIVEDVTIENIGNDDTTLILIAEGDIYVQNVTVTSGTRLVLDAGGEVIVGENVDVQSGADFEIK